jgi:nitroreductase
MLTIALTYLELAAPAFGLGTCWGGFLNAAANAWSPVQKTLALPEGNTSYGVMMVGKSPSAFVEFYPRLCGKYPIYVLV